MATTSFSGHRVLLQAPGYPNVGISFLGTAFSEPTLIRLASGFDAATQAASPPLSRVPRPDRRPFRTRLSFLEAGRPRTAHNEVGPLPPPGQNSSERLAPHL